ncbi:MAG: hypothetical protein RLZZ324_456 [Candidatus Parcubacteria bacterium]|jgi:hypothetical protein
MIIEQSGLLATDDGRRISIKDDAGAESALVIVGMDGTAQGIALRARDGTLMRTLRMVCLAQKLNASADPKHPVDLSYVLRAALCDDDPDAPEPPKAFVGFLQMMAALPSDTAAELMIRVGITLAGATYKRFEDLLDAVLADVNAGSPQVYLHGVTKQKDGRITARFAREGGQAFSLLSGNARKDSAFLTVNVQPDITVSLSAMHALCDLLRSALPAEEIAATEVEEETPVDKEFDITLN